MVLEWIVEVNTYMWRNYYESELRSVTIVTSATAHAANTI